MYGVVSCSPGSGRSQRQLLLSGVVRCPPPYWAAVSISFVAVDEALNVGRHRDACRIGCLVCFRPRLLVDSGLEQHSLETSDVGTPDSTSDCGHAHIVAVNGCIRWDATGERSVSPSFGILCRFGRLVTRPPLWAPGCAVEGVAWPVERTGPSTRRRPPPVRRSSGHGLTRTWIRRGCCQPRWSTC